MRRPLALLAASGLVWSLAAASVWTLLAARAAAGPAPQDGAEGVGCDLTAVTDCLAPHPGTGCTEPCIQEVVCAIDPYCCDVEWDRLCAEEASAHGPCDCNGDGTPDVCDPALAATEVVRLGVPPNPAALLPGVTQPPVLGRTWDPVVDHTTFVPDSIADVLVVSPVSLNLPLGELGTLLCDLGGLLVPAPAPGAPFELAVPVSCELVGATVCTQAGSLNSLFEISLTNALDVTVGVH